MAATLFPLRLRGEGAPAPFGPSAKPVVRAAPVYIGNASRGAVYRGTRGDENVYRGARRLFP